MNPNAIAAIDRPSPTYPYFSAELKSLCVFAFLDCEKKTYQERHSELSLIPTAAWVVP